MTALIDIIEESQKNDTAIFLHIDRVVAMLKDGLKQLTQEYEQYLYLYGHPGS
jgi:hypothetical protein